MNKKHKIIIVLIVVLFIGGLSVYLFTNKNSLDGKVVKKSSINLNNYKDNIILKKGGEYTLTGEFEHSVLIDSSEKVILNLNNVDIENKVNTAIANINNNQLVINILENTKNELSSRGESEYDGCIFSNGEIIINGPGSLKIRGRQKEGDS